MASAQSGALDQTSCAAIKDTRKRLACYDKAAAPTPAPADAVVSPRKPSKINTSQDAVGRAGELKLREICRGC